MVIDLKSQHAVGLGFLGIGRIRPCFHALGKYPEIRDSLMIFVSSSKQYGKHISTILPDKPSEPGPVSLIFLQILYRS